MTPLIERDTSDTTQAVYTRNPLSIGGIGGLISAIQPALPAAGHIPEVAIDRGRVLNVIFNTYYYHDSNLGNVNQITDSTGAVVQTYDYDSFGNIVNQTGSLTIKYAYKTKEYSPETGLVFFGARYYNPLIGRFITKDPLGMVDGPNQYIYCWNDPINRIDLWGNICIGQIPKWLIVLVAGSYASPVPVLDDAAATAILAGYVGYLAAKAIVNEIKQAVKDAGAKRGPPPNQDQNIAKNKSKDKQKNSPQPAPSGQNQPPTAEKIGVPPAGAPPYGPFGPNEAPTKEDKPDYGNPFGGH